MEDQQDSDKPHSSQQQFETYKKIDVLGKGSFGKAFLVECGSDKVGIEVYYRFPKLIDSHISRIELSSNQED